MKQIVTTSFAGKEVTIESGQMAKQADGSVVVRSGDNAVLVTAVSSKRESGLDFFPLTVEYSEKFYATGRIPGGYFKREGRPTSAQILTCRLIDRPLRPLFPEGYSYETQIIATVISADGQFPTEILASLGASAALHISDVPFNGPNASIQVAKVDGKLIGNPTLEEVERAELDMIVSGSRRGISMVEGECEFITEADALEALKFGHEQIMSVLDAQDELREKMGNKEKRTFEPRQIDAGFKSEVSEFLAPKIKAALSIKEKLARYEASDAAKKEALEKFCDSIADKDEKAQASKDVGTIVGDLKYEIARSLVLETGSRIDGRSSADIRKITCEVDMLPRAHGSGLFTRGETQVLGSVTLGTGADEQYIDALHGTEKRQFMLHYNFPPYCVGETGRVGGQSRREIGHGFLAERALAAVMPAQEDFPYVTRIVSEVLESNGSSSMGSVCAGCMALLDAGVPLKGNVAGIAMGLIKEGEKYAILSDILGDEDHLGDMDFKVAGTREGITSIQMDMKIDSISFEIVEKALIQALAGRTHILDEMEKAISKPKGELSPYAPRITTFKVSVDKIKDIIGSGGKVIRGIVDETGVKINIEDDGTVNVASSDPKATEKALAIINGIIEEAEVGKTYTGKVVKVTDFGAFVEVLPNTSGLLHISEIAHERIREVTDVINEGDEVQVKVLDVDRAGRIKLSRKALLDKPDSAH